MPWQKGQSGNPAGRRPRVVEQAQSHVLAELFDETEEIAVVVAMITKAKMGAVDAATWLWDRKYGKVSDRTQHEGEVTIRVEYADALPDADDPQAPSNSADDPDGSPPI